MKLKRGEYFKLARPNGWDFHTGNTINYRESVGREVRVKDLNLNPVLCSSAVLHACKIPQNCFVGAKIPCSMYIVTGKPVIEDESKSGFRVLHVDREIEEGKFNEIFGFKYSLAAKPLEPRTVTAPAKIDDQILKELNVWATVRASIEASVRGSVWASVRDSVEASVWDSVEASVRGSVWASVRGSVYDLEAAWVGTIFPVKKWKYTDKFKVRGYPFQSAINLLDRGLLPVHDYKNGIWNLLGGKDMKILWKGNVPSKEAA